MFEPFKVASTNAKVLHVFMFLFVLMSWISTIVTFSQPLMDFEVAESLPGIGGNKFKVYWNRVETHYNIPGFVNPSMEQVLGAGCKSGGEATLAFAVFAFLLSLVHVNILAARIGGWSFPGVRNYYQSITVELLLAMGTWFCFFIQVCVWGGACFTQIRTERQYLNENPTGFSFMLACFFFLLAVIVAYLRMKQNPDLCLGNGASKAGTTSSYTEPATQGHYSSEDDYSYQGSAAL